MYWLAQAPANIALIKYMGKKDVQLNLPDNASLSYTLSNLLSIVRLERLAKGPDRWEPLANSCMNEVKLTTKGQARFIDHLQRLKEYFGYSGHFLVQSKNNFPQGSGLASSASSFAALTRVAVDALCELTGQIKPTIEAQAHLSRLGSGSSCRSFFSPWVLWEESKVVALDFPYTDLLHQVIVISAREKEVSSSDAHLRVRTSAQYHDRPERAKARLNELLKAFQEHAWSTIHRVCWDEFQDMHHLFISCDQPFTYINKESHNILNQLQVLWEQQGDGPIVTMDAGPNIHLLYRADQAELAKQFKAEHLDGRYHVL
jgi:diphosphomevalonate decarboxylase